VLPLEEVRMAHEMLAGAPHKRGKIVLTMAFTRSGHECPKSRASFATTQR
jgi:hypothetical protein